MRVQCVDVCPASNGGLPAIGFSVCDGSTEAASSSRQAGRRMGRVSRTLRLPRGSGVVGEVLGDPEVSAIDGHADSDVVEIGVGHVVVVTWTVNQSVECLP